MSFEGAPRSSSASTPEPVVREIRVKRSDAIYNAHAYLTKIPYTAIVPLLEAFTEPGDTVLEMFAGSGMTGVAAAITGRDAELRDISVLGRHVGTNYLSHVDAEEFRSLAKLVVMQAQDRLGDVYRTSCENCGQAGTLSKAIWTFEYECPTCGHELNYHKRLAAAEWSKRDMTCPACKSSFSSRNSERRREVRVVDHVLLLRQPGDLSRHPGRTHPVKSDKLLVPIEDTQKPIVGFLEPTNDRR